MEFSSITQVLADNRIDLRSMSAGNHKSRCPQCSGTRKNKKDPCLSVKIDNDGCTWNCHNCGWHGGLRYSYSGTRQQPQRRQALGPPQKLDGYAKLQRQAAPMWRAK